MRRLQSRLIAAFLGVVILTMIPLSLFHYLWIDNWFDQKRHLSINIASNHFKSEFNNRSNALYDHFQPAYIALNKFLPTSSDWVLDFTQSKDYTNLKEQEDFIWNTYVEKTPLNQILEKGKHIRVYPKEQYLQMQEWMKQKRLYEEDNTIYYYASYPAFKGQTANDMEPVGGFFVMLPLIEKTEEAKNYKLIQLSDTRTRVIGPSPLLLKDSLSEEQYHQLYELHEEIEVDSFSVEWLFNGKPVQGWMKPIINQHGHVSAVVIIWEQIFDAWEMVGPNIFQSGILVSIVMIFLAVIISRSISKPMYELVGVAKDMSHGDFSARIEVKGTTEQQVLRQTFNQLAERITQQLDQLQQQTNKLEISNRELEETQRFLQNILVNVHIGVLSVDCKGNITLINDECRNILQVEIIEGSEFSNVIQSKVLTGVIKYSLENCVCIYQQEILYERNNNESIPLQVSTVPMLQMGQFTGIVVTIHDLSALRKLEAEVRRHDRLVALGRMAGGLAHEIRNPLGIIRGSAEILHKRFGTIEGEEGLSIFIMEEVVRLSRVLTDFLHFARPPVPVMEVVSAHELIDSILPYVQKSEQYDIECQIAPDTPMIKLDLELCKQAFLNLILNAQDAMENGGTIWIKIKPARMESVSIEVVDEGVGISNEMIERIFDPFVTSKDTGTGLGLSLVHQIISSQNGKIEVDSQVGKGCIFRIEFPAHKSAIDTVKYSEALV